MKVLYFAWLRERLNRSEEEVLPPSSVTTVAALLDWLSASDAAAAALLSDRRVIRVAVDAVLASPETPVAATSVVALFPPMTGG